MTNMKREILFRGKGVHSEEWVYGDLIHGVGERHGMISILPITKNLAKIPYCDPLDGVYVNPDTVGQFIGLTDKNGNKIFEGDILQKWEVDWEADERNNFEGEEPFIATKKDVATMDRFPVFWLQNESFGYEGDDLEDSDKWEIIGNISDNPELLK